ncbi:MAG: peptide-methionine (R)-S-oxide reductase [Flavobacterium sp. BFFFF1]|uniref:peptide-methionine (R)-S-oxide reductase MsrB n=1 Tax=unclassified Flavobacterium TaxID=196869 RepID=UPI000BC64FFB|nr:MULTISPECIES: peptide-methionine (R)-S-oxide reductase MsrB [unclassified Flavobacterium]OYU81749.1 MAG: peptide-methionine (R)-S-oxide reductase [Flavobacterium sp. BFFFF1]
MKKTLFLILSICSFAVAGAQEIKTSNTSGFEVEKTDAEWKKQLTPEQYEVLRNKGTEKPNTGAYVNNFEKGTYVCAACGNLIFNSDAKFKSDCGWPTFDKAVKNSIIFVADDSTGTVRTEAACSRCGSHLGHVFDDGPAKTTGKRFCTNSVAIKFVAEK